MGYPENDPVFRSIETRGFKQRDDEDEDHDQDLIEWLAAKGIRAPDWSLDPSIFDRVERLETGKKNPIKRVDQTVVAGVYLFYTRSSRWQPLGEGEARILALYVGKAANLWNRMQAHFCRPEERGWFNSYLTEINNGTLDEIVMACSWAEEERAGVEARLIEVLKPRYCRRRE